MPTLKQVESNRRMRLRNGKKLALRARAEAAATVWFGVHFTDGASVFMPRRAGLADRDFNAIRAYALRVRGLKPDREAEIVVTAEACDKCAHSIPGCAGCGFSDAVAAWTKEQAEESHGGSH